MKKRTKRRRGGEGRETGRARIHWGSHGEPGFQSSSLSPLTCRFRPKPFSPRLIFIGIRSFTSGVTRRETSRDEIAPVSNAPRHAYRRAIIGKRYTSTRLLQCSSNEAACMCMRGVNEFNEIAGRLRCDVNVHTITLASRVGTNYKSGSLRCDDLSIRAPGPKR